MLGIASVSMGYPPRSHTGCCEDPEPSQSEPCSGFRPGFCGSLTRLERWQGRWPTLGLLPSDRSGGPDAHELPSRIGREKVSIGAPDMRDAGCTRPAAQPKLVSHKFAVILPQRVPEAVGVPWDILGIWCSPMSVNEIEQCAVRCRVQGAALQRRGRLDSGGRPLRQCERCDLQYQPDR